MACKIFSAIRLAAVGTCHWASAACMVARKSSCAIKPVKMAATCSGEDFFCSNSLAAPFFSKAEALKN